jgi:excisionase family DNA binding protein
MEQIIETVVERVVRRVMREEYDRTAPASSSSSGAEYLTLAQAAKRMQVSKTTVREWVKAGHLKNYGVGRVVRVRRAELDELQAAPTTTTTDVVETAITNIATKLAAKRSAKGK